MDFFKGKDGAARDQGQKSQPFQAMNFPKLKGDTAAPGSMRISGSSVAARPNRAVGNGHADTSSPPPEGFVRFYQDSHRREP
jgi:hypothetical protein